ncbi:MAG: alpha/beta hydrolase [Actinomycetota bacterium]|nr:alpha/beta hydrolase [Actinomycetota bacterium]
MSSLRYDHAGQGGRPLLLLHGWPETRRIWKRNVEPLAAAGFEVIAPDLRGFGDSPLAPDDRYDVATHSHDLRALMNDELGHERISVCAGDLGGVIAQDMSLRFEGLVERLCLFNTIAPRLPAGGSRPRTPADSWPATGKAPDLPPLTRMAADYFVRQSKDADGLAAELDTPEKRRHYVATFYSSRFWAAPGTFTRVDIDYLTEPFADAERFRASIANYEYAGGPRRAPEIPRLLETNPTPTLILYGPEDHVIPPDFPERMEAAFPDRAGPFVVPGAGHFLQWERAEVLNGALRWLCLR